VETSIEVVQIKIEIPQKYSNLKHIAQCFEPDRLQGLGIKSKEY
jgi:hypothetical protein